MKKFIGWCILSSPFIGVFAYAAHVDGLLVATTMYAGVVGVAAIIWAGVYLITEGEQ